MPAIPESSPAVAPSVIAGLLLAASDYLAQLGLAHPTVDEITTATGAGRSSAYDSRAKILGLLPSLAPRVGRPPAPASPAPATAGAVTLEVARFVMEHPGCVHGSERRQYGESFRKFVLDLQRRHRELGIEALAEATDVPAETLRDWMRVGATAPPAPEPAPTPPPAASPRSLHIEAILAEWKTWHGGFVPFCKHVRENLRIDFGRTAISAILEAHGMRSPQRRSGEHSPDEAALRKSFQKFFPGAQWVADGTPVVVDFLGERFRFNLELEVDAHSGAFTGASVRDEEDGAALVESFEDGKATTGAPPLAVLVDNRPSNLTPEVREALGETLLIPATPGRGQNKAHVEGAFGLFFQQAPLLLLSASGREGARELLSLVVTTWARTLNHRPRRDRNGRSRVDLYGDKPTPEQIAQARRALQERLRQQQLARATLQARQDPVVRQILAQAFARLGFEDPEGHLLDGIARYPLSAVVDGVGTFEGKRAAGTLPSGVDARYLLGIVRNISQEREASQISEAILHGRLEARDALLALLVEQKASLFKQETDPPGLLASLVDHALGTDRRLDRLFWLEAAGDIIRHASAGRVELYRVAARRIHATRRVGCVDRARATRFLANKAFPLE